MPNGVYMDGGSCYCHSDNKKARSFTSGLFRKLCSETANEIAALCCCTDDERSENVKTKLIAYGYTGRFAKDDSYTRTISQRIKYGPKPQRKQEKHTDFSAFFGY